MSPPIHASPPIHVETRQIVDAEEKLRQGDIFEWVEEHRDEPWRFMGIVVTADCDIAQKKHGGILSYVPLLKASEYVRLFVLPGQLQKVVSDIHSQMMKRVHALQAQYQPGFPDLLSAKVIESLLLENGSAFVLDSLDVPPGKSRSDANVLLEDVITGLNAQRGGGWFEQFEAIVRLRGGKPQHRNKLLQQIADKFAALPGDAFFVGEVEGASDKGFVAYLRFVREVPISEIALKMPDLQEKGATARRIARMSAPFVYRLTQQLGDVFSAIGLPKSYETSRDGYISATWPKSPMETK